MRKEGDVCLDGKGWVSCSGLVMKGCHRSDRIIGVDHRPALISLLDCRGDP